MKSLIKILSLILCLFAVISLAVACAPAEPPHECPPHVDENGDNICDVCKEIIEPDEPDEPVGPDFSKTVFADKAVTYKKGTAHSIFVENIPEDVEVMYIGNGKEAAGEYTVEAHFYYGGAELVDKKMTATLTVNRATYDMSGVTLPSVSVTYTGDAVTTGIEGTLPTGVTATVTYKDADGNDVDEIIDGGKYTAWATFKGDSKNYYSILPISATVTVLPASVGGISFKDTSFVYDGTVKTITVTGVPSDITVDYSIVGASAPGKYEIVAKFNTGANYLPIPDMTATMTIRVENPESIVTPGIKYEKLATGDYTVVGIEGEPEVVVIPATYEGANVISIGQSAFRNQTKLCYVYISDGVKVIGGAAFDGCSKLEYAHFGEITALGQNAFRNTGLVELVLPDTLTVIGKGALSGTPLVKLTVPFVGSGASASNPYFGYIFGAGAAGVNANYVPDTLEELVISNACTEIYPNALYGLSSLKTVIIGQGVKKIGNNAFYGCSGLRDIYLPQSVTSIPANVSPKNSPFYNCSEELLIVVENISCASGFMKYFADVSDYASALVVYNKTYDDYVMNKDSFRQANPSDSSLAGIFIGDELVSGFNPSVLEYTAEVDINVGFKTLSALTTSASASLSIVKASGDTDNVATITVVSADGTSTTTYKITFTVTGTFDATAAVVNKGNANGTVTFVVDDGLQPTATFMKSMVEKYRSLAVSYAIATKKFGTAATAKGEDGLSYYDIDEDGNYTYTSSAAQNTTIAFWQDILSAGRSEIVSHSQSHAFFGYNDAGGTQLCVGSTGNVGSGTLTVGSMTAEFALSQQIIKEIFGDTSRGITFVTPGIAPKESDYTLPAAVDHKISNGLGRLVSDTAISVAGGAITLNSATEVDLQSVIVTLPAGTTVTTTATADNNVLAKGTVIGFTATVNIPAGTVIKGFKTNFFAMYDEMIESGVMIGARSTGSGDKFYTASDFTSIETRKAQKSHMITTPTDASDEKIESSLATWKGYIDQAVTSKTWTTFCIHAITPEPNDETGEGKHRITQYQAEELFAYTESFGKQVWIASLTDATLYYHQWSTSTVTTEFDGTAVKVSLTDKENDEIYDMALTVRVQVPATWSSAKVGDTVYEIERTARACYVYVDIAPETTVSVVEG